MESTHPRSVFQTMDPDRRIRVAAFTAIEKLSRQWGGQIPWEAIRVGFQAGGDETVLFATRAKGIFKPRQMSAALSINTTVPRSGRSLWYRDQSFDAANLDGATGLLRYDLSRGGREDPTNRALRAPMRRGTPEEVFECITRYYPQERAPPGTRFLVEELLGADRIRPAPGRE